MSLESARQTVKERAYGKCEPCGDNPLTEIHHHITRGSGGVHGARAEVINNPPNFLAACRRCHNWITGNPALALAYGWVIERRSGLAPDLVPALISTTNGRGWWFLTEDGGYQWAASLNDAALMWPLPWQQVPWEEVKIDELGGQDLAGPREGHPQGRQHQAG